MSQIRGTIKSGMRLKGGIKANKLKASIKGDCPIITHIDGGDDPATPPSTINGYLNGGEI